MADYDRKWSSLTINARVTAIMEKVGFDTDRFTAEVRRAVAGRRASV